MKPLVCLSVTNDLTADQRVHKMCCSLLKLDYTVLLIGRELPRSVALNRPYPTHRLKCLFNKGPLFYLEFNLRLAFFLISRKPHVLFANDVDTLPANYLASKAIRKPLVLDCHEYFSQVPELTDRGLVQKVWETIEAYFIPKVNQLITVSEPIAQTFASKFGKQASLIYNYPLQQTPPSTHTNVPPKPEGLLFIYQGAVNADRGLEDLIAVLPECPNVHLWVIGNGDVWVDLITQTNRTGLSDRVLFLGQLPFDQLSAYTQQADAGILLDKDTNLNYRYSVPNRLYDYIKAGIPILSSGLPASRKRLEDIGAGYFVNPQNKNELKEAILYLANHPTELAHLKKQAKLHALDFTWEQQEGKIKQLMLQATASAAIKSEA